jgi:tetratricopeptide (TPR) repeat protein
MRLWRDSWISLLARAVLLAAPIFVLAAPADAATAKKPVKPVAKVAAVEPQPDAGTLIIQAHDAQGRGETELALRLAQAAIVADPAGPSAYDALGDVYAANNQPDYARSYYGEALSIDPADDAARKAMDALDHPPGQQAKANDEGPKTGTP